MARCEECIHYEVCLKFADVRIILCGDKADTKCNMFKPTADVAPRVEVFEAVDKFRSDLMGKFIDLCRGNDYNKLTLLKIDDVVCKIYDKQIAELKKKYTDAPDTNVGHK